MCKIIKGEEASEMMDATLEEMKLRKLLNALQKTKDVVDHNHNVVSEALNRLIKALHAELEDITKLWEGKNNVNGM